MAQYKGTGVYVIHKLLAAKGQEAPGQFQAKLTPDELKLFRLVTPASWLPLDAAARLLEKAAAVIYPGDPRGLHKLGREQALEHINSIYRAILRVVSVELAIAKSAFLWKMYFDQGQVSAGKDTEKLERSCWLKVANFPDLPPVSREVVNGYLEGVLELSGVKNIRITREDSQPAAWKWTLRWDQ